MEIGNQTAFNPENTTYLRNFLVILFKRKYVIISVFVVIVILTALFSFLMPPSYESEATLLLERELDSEKSLLFRMDLSRPNLEYNWISSELELIKSYAVAEKVLSSVDSGKAVNRESDQTQLRWTDQGGFERGVRHLIQNIKVVNPKKTNIVKIRYRDKDPQNASRILNHYLSTYVTYRSQLANQSESYQFLQDQIEITEKKLQELEKKQAVFKQENKVISPEAYQQLLINKMTDFDRRLTEVRTKIIGKKAALSVIRKQLKSGERLNIPRIETSDSPSREKYIADLKGKLLEFEVRKESLLQKFTPQYEEVVNLQKQIDATKSKLRDEISQIIEMEQMSIHALEAEEGVLRKSIYEISEEIKNFAEKEYEYNQITRGLKDTKEVYSILLKQREETGISLAKMDKGVKIKVINRAITPLDPVFPNIKLNLVLAMFLGVFTGLSLALLLEFFDHRINTVEEIEKYTGLRNLGFVRQRRI